MEEEDKKEKTKKQAQGNKGKTKKGKKKEQLKQTAKQEKPQWVKKENSVETNSLSDTSEHAQQTLKVNPFQKSLVGSIRKIPMTSRVPRSAFDMLFDQKLTLVTKAPTHHYIAHLTCKD